MTIRSVDGVSVALWLLPATAINRRHLGIASPVVVRYGYAARVAPHERISDERWQFRGT